MLEIASSEKIEEKIVVGMGFFDCVHAGHRVLIERVKAKARELSAKSAVITFSNNPYNRFEISDKLIYTYSERCLLFKDLDINYVIPFEFDERFGKTSKDDFLRDLFERFDIAGIVCGYDYRFGNNGDGNAEYLKHVAAQNNISLSVIEPVLLNGERVSSTLVKETLRSGNIKKANFLLTVPYFMTGEVIHGRGVGKIYGFPTANINISADKMLVKNGVYATRTVYDGEVRKSVTNVGAKPTFDESVVSVETLIKDEKADLYGKQIKLEFTDFLRDIQKFSSPRDLADRIKKDIEY